VSAVPASPGLAAGRLVRFAAASRAPRRPGTPDEERGALLAAIAAAREGLAVLAGKNRNSVAEEILVFQLELLDDGTLTEPVLEAIAKGAAADAAWERALAAEIDDFAAASDAYFRGRAADLCDLRDRVLERLCGTVSEPLPRGAIVVAEELAPSQFLATDWNGGGLVLHRGSATSHVAILARARGVPMLVGVDPAQLNGHREALLDAAEGVLVLDPDASTRAAFERRRAEHAAQATQERAFLAREARTGAGERVRVMINVGDPQELESIDPAHADGIGLVRTEFLFHGRARLPDEEEQLQVYRRIAAWARGRPVTIRTLDAGGDKPIAGLTRDAESNPFLGVRGVRLALRRPDVFHVQLRALARAAVAGNLKIMVPMVTTPHELARCREMFRHALAELAAEGIAAAPAPLGMMVEVPVAALEAERFEADFYSIGSNDLIQYLNAASRDEPELAPLARPSAGLWRLVREICEKGLRAGREVSLCGDLASDPRFAPALLDCGLRTFSVAPAALAAVKAALARHGTRS
jgi:phosphotransferase system enzyme I (PtsI)